ncbi:hypothetical protein CEXT_497811 [Caerostris extrusa]|uniref:Uncharacterized protein n=1 Tax=Caerostris extrusa TaxID=172846 RepID=A0AAV4TWB8_CAEEX|nr:hypothetical protein CEXT_497811 [Caerostris extrusa]
MEQSVKLCIVDSEAIVKVKDLPCNPLILPRIYAFRSSRIFIPLPNDECKIQDRYVKSQTYSAYPTSTKYSVLMTPLIYTMRV